LCQPPQQLLVLLAERRDALLDGLETGRAYVADDVDVVRHRLRVAHSAAERGDAAREPARAPPRGRGVGHQDDHRHGHQRQRERRASGDGPARRRRV